MSRRILPAFVVLAACRSGAATSPPPSPTPDPPMETSAVSDATPPVATEAVDAAPPVVAVAVAETADAGPPSAAPTPSTPVPPDGMLYVPGGTFTMGADKGGEQDEHPAHKVTLSGFFLDRTEVTQAAYGKCVADGKCKPPDPAAIEVFGGLFKGPKKPVVGVSWFEAGAYCTYMGRRLPREAEHERAIRGDDARSFPWGNDAPTPERAVFSTNAPEDVGSHPAGKGPYGHDDLVGNVWEWTSDDYDPYAYQRSGAGDGKPGSCVEIEAAQNELRAKGKQGYTGTNPIPVECEKSIRGGAYNYGPTGLRATNRVHHPPTFRLRMTGFRCAKDAG